MERIIKFRGKRVDNGEWVYGHLLHCNHTCSVDMSDKDMGAYYIVPLRFNISALKPVMVSPETVGQFANLSDQGGKTEIYEDDVVSNAGIEYVVKCTNGCWWLIDRYAVFCCQLNNMLSEVKIIGNIHDNSKLFKTYRMSKPTYIYKVSFRNELAGDNVWVTNVFFNSLSAIYDKFTVKQIGCGVNRLWDLKITPQNPYLGRKCTITAKSL